MTLANVVPQVGPDPKTGVSGMGTFVGGSNPFPASCALRVFGNWYSNPKFLIFRCYATGPLMMPQPPAITMPLPKCAQPARDRF